MKKTPKRIKEYIEASGQTVDGFWNDMSARQGLILLEELLTIKKTINKFALQNKSEVKKK